VLRFKEGRASACLELIVTRLLSTLTKTKTLLEPGLSIQPQSSPTPAPLAVAVSKAKASVSSGAVSDSSVQPVTPPRQRAPALAKDPAVFEARSAGSARATPTARRPSASRNPSSTGTSAQRSISQSSTQRPRQRDRSTSEQPTFSSTTRSFQSPVRQSGKAPARASLARTMTTGKGNQGMSNRMTDSRQMSNRPAVGTGRLRAPTVGRKTTSALFREIDDLVSQDTGEQDGGAGITGNAWRS
jgi:hypothetical protein